MDQLDLLKKDWKKQDASLPKFSQNELSKLMHKKSSSIVKWIFIISILELIIPNVVYLFIKDEPSVVDDYKFLNIIYVIFYITIFYFIYRFYKNYKKISVLSTSKKLMNDIKETRKVVKQYIWFNIIAGGIISIILMFLEFRNEEEITTGMDYGAKVVVFIVMAIFVLAFLTLFVWLFYHLLYGILLGKLNRNYHELVKEENGDL